MLLSSLLLSAVTSCAGGGRIEAKDDVKVILNWRGRALKTDGDTAGLVELALQSLRTCDGIYELVVTQETIEQLREHERCVEIVFPAPQEVLVGGRESLGIARVLVPLTGRFAEGQQMTLFCGFPTYSSGPYLKTHGLQVFITEVDGLRWQ